MKPSCTKPSGDARLGALLVLGLLASFLTPSFATAQEDAEPPVATLLAAARAGVIGTQAPAFELETIDGERIDLANLYGKQAVYLKFWATWCQPCRRQMPHFENVYRSAGDDLAVIAINAGFNESLEDIREFREDYGIHMPIVVDDGSLANAFNLRVTPQHIVIGRDGTILYVGQAADAGLEQALVDARSMPARRPTSSPEPAELAVRPYLGPGDLLPESALRLGTDESIALRADENGSVLVFMIPWCEDYLQETRPAAAVTCARVREQVETLKQARPDLRWLGLNAGLWTVARDLRRYTAKYRTTLPLGLDGDGELFRSFGVMSVPTVIVADASGRIVARLEGYDPSLEAVLSALTATE